MDGNISVNLGEIDLEEQRAIQASIEQEAKDRELAQHLAREEQRRDVVHHGVVAYAGGGPIRRERARRGSLHTRPQRNRTASENVLRFNGNRLEARNGDDVVDVTAYAHLPEDDDDDAFEIDGEPDGRPESPITLSSDGSSLEDSDSEPEAPAEFVRVVRGVPQRRIHRPVQNRRRNPAPAVRANYIQALLADLGNRRDRNYRPGRIEVAAAIAAAEDDSGSDISDGSDLEEEEEDEEEDVIDVLSDDDEVGPVHREPNNINQEFLDDDHDMYQSELDLWNDDDHYEVPPASIPKHKGKEIEPDSTWGDCTMCFNPPVKPQGCKKCLQFIGCADCVRRWHASRTMAMERSSCPLCRAQWSDNAPGVNLMPTIDKHRQKRDGRQGSSSSSSNPAGPSSSSA